MYKVLISARAQKELSDVPANDYSKIKDKIISIDQNPRPSGVTKLEGCLHRVRVGNWRILYDIYDSKKEVLVLRVLRRSERTYKGI